MAGFCAFCFVKGSTIIFVTHDTETVCELCDEAIWLDGGRIMLQGRPKVVVDQYIAASDAASDQRQLVDTASTAV